MNKAIPPLKLLAFPCLLIGMIQLIFGLLSAFVFKDNIARLFIFPSLAILILAAILFFKNYRKKLEQINFRESMLYVTYTWVICGVLGAIPFQLIEHVSFTDAVFESISALTTTGATILTNLDDMPKSFLMYRQFLQWIGGLGVIIFVVAILPMLNIGGMKILKAETPGPIKDDKLAPRIANSAQYFWYIYLAITFLCCIGYVLSGLSWFEAIAHSFSTVSTGGFSTHDASLGYFNNAWTEINADIFMLLGATSFSLHFRFSRSLDFKVYTEDQEINVFTSIIIFLSIVLTLIIISNGDSEHLLDTFQHAVFILISFITSTGFGAHEFNNWPAATGLILIFSGFLGGCAGSTAGGNKIIRNILAFKIIAKQIKSLIHSYGKFSIHYNGKKVDDDVLSATMAFITFSAFISIILTLTLMLTGLSFWGAFSAVSACINVLGPAFGELGNNFQPVNDFGTWVLSLTMLLGRLEFFTILVIFSRYFWRH